MVVEENVSSLIYAVSVKKINNSWESQKHVKNRGVRRIFGKLKYSHMRRYMYFAVVLLGVCQNHIGYTQNIFEF